MVSTASAQNVLQTLPEAAVLFMSSEGEIQKIPSSELSEFSDPFIREFHSSGGRYLGSLEQAIQTEKLNEGVVILALHGGTGEDGTIQAVFERHRVPFTGSGSAASALAMDKRRSKEIAESKGIATAKDTEVSADELADDPQKLYEIFQSIGPMIAKPRSGGSTLGAFFVRTQTDCEKVSLAIRKGEVYESYLCEALLSGREFTVGVLEVATKRQALPPSEVVLASQREFDYEGKYLGKGVTEVTPAQIDTSLKNALQQLAMNMHEALGCRGYSRTDIIWDGKDCYYLETNTLPGLSKASFIPQQLQAADIEFRKFLEGQVLIALEK